MRKKNNSNVPDGGEITIDVETETHQEEPYNFFSCRPSSQCPSLPSTEEVKRDLRKASRTPASNGVDIAVSLSTSLPVFLLVTVLMDWIAALDLGPTLIFSLATALIPTFIQQRLTNIIQWWAHRGTTECRHQATFFEGFMNHSTAKVGLALGMLPMFLALIFGGEDFVNENKSVLAWAMLTIILIGSQAEVANHSRNSYLSENERNNNDPKNGYNRL